MADLDLRNVQNIANSEAFSSDVSFLLSQAGRFRDIAALTLRQLLSTSLIQSGAADPGESDKIANTTVFYIQTTDETLHVSLAGGNWIEVGGGSATFTDEEFQDKLHSLITAGSNISITYDDQNNTFTIAATDTNTQLTDEELQDKIGAFLVAGSNITLTYDDNAGTLTIASTGTGQSGLTIEDVRDAIAAFIQGGTNVTVTHDDTNDTLTIAATGDGSGLSEVASSSAFSGDGTGGSPLDLRNLGIVFAKLAHDVVQEISQDLIKVKDDHPAAADLVALTSQILFDHYHGDTWFSNTGADWQQIRSHLLIESHNDFYVEDWDVRISDTPAPSARFHIYSNGQTISISETTSGTTTAYIAYLLNSVRRGDAFSLVSLGSFVVNEVGRRETGTPNTWIFNGSWIGGSSPTLDSDQTMHDDTGIAIIPGGARIASNALETRHYKNASITLAKLAAEVRDQLGSSSGGGLTAVRSDATLEGDGTSSSPLGVAPGAIDRSRVAAALMKIGTATALGRWERTGTSPPADGTFTNPNATTLLFNSTNDADTDMASIFLALRQGDKLKTNGGDHTIFTLSGTPTRNGDAITVSGAWQGAAPSFISSTNYRFSYILKEHLVGKSSLVPGHILVVASDYQIESVRQSDQFFSSDDDGQLGEFETFGSWTRTSSSAAGSPGDVYFDPSGTTLKLHQEDSGAESRGTALEGLESGDRLQFGDTNVFVLSADPVDNNGVFTLTGVWGDVFAAGDFDGMYTVYLIKKKNVLIRNTAVPGRHLRVGDGRMPVAVHPGEDLETIWMGSVNTASSHALTAKNLNAGKKFSDYKLLLFRCRGRVRPRWSFAPVSAFDATGNMIEVGGRGETITVQWLSDTTFNVPSGYGDESTYLNEIVGMRG